MIILYGAIMIAYGWLWLRSRKGEYKSNSPFRAIASEVESLISSPVERSYRREQMKQLNSILHNHKRVAMLEHAHQIEMIELVVKLVFIGTLLASALYVVELRDTQLSQGNQIERNDYSMGSGEHHLLADIGEERFEIPITISELKYSTDQIEELFAVYEVVLEEEMLANNESIGHVTENLIFPVMIDGYPFINEWRTSNHSVIRSDGRIVEELEERNGIFVEIAVLSSYYEYERTYVFQTIVYPKEQSDDELRIASLTQMIEEADVDTLEEMAIALPTTIGEETIAWRKRQEGTSFYLFVLSVIAGCAIVLSKKKELQDALAKRESQMVLDYAPMINQLVLYLGAGMTMRSAFTKIVSDYQSINTEESRYAYEELRNMCQELESGVSEIEAYENFGNRCNNRTYLKLATLLSQNARKGASELLMTLKKESAVAFEERKLFVRVKAEQATTKLLIPMVMMLGVVMVIIMIPAFLSFQI